MKKYQWPVLAILVIVLSAYLALPPKNEAGSTVPLSIISDNSKVMFDVEIADTNEERTQGLMYRRSLSPKSGMLFIFEQEQIVEMWMKNTYIPLDMLFIARDGSIVKIIARTTPFSEDILSSGKPAKAVLEINGGEAEALGIKAGDRIKNHFLK